MLKKYCSKIKKVLVYCVNSCYHRIRIGKDIERSIMEKAIFDSRQLACYVSDMYEKQYGKEISEIKLQKTMYFLFAYWGGFIAKNGFDSVEEKFDYSKYLYATKIQAWVYGPVLPEIYSLNKRKKLNNYRISENELFKDKEFVKETIDSIMYDLFELSDFKLVSLSHEDNVWKNNFDLNSECHNREMKLDSIIKEYAEKETI